MRQKRLLTQLHSQNLVYFIKISQRIYNGWYNTDTINGSFKCGCTLQTNYHGRILFYITEGFQNIHNFKYKKNQVFLFQIETVTKVINFLLCVLEKFKKRIQVRIQKEVHSNEITSNIISFFILANEFFQITENLMCQFEFITKMIHFSHK